MATLQKHGELDGSAGDARVEKIIHNIYSRLVGRSVVDLVFDWDTASQTQGRKRNRVGSRLLGGKKNNKKSICCLEFCDWNIWRMKNTNTMFFFLFFVFTLWKKLCDLLWPPSKFARQRADGLKSSELSQQRNKGFSDVKSFSSSRWRCPPSPCAKALKNV